MRNRLTQNGQYVELGNFGSGLFLVDLLVAINEGGGVGDNGNGDCIVTLADLRWWFWSVM